MRGYGAAIGMLNAHAGGKTAAKTWAITTSARTHGVGNPLNPLQRKGLAGSGVIRKSNGRSPAQVVVPQALAWGVAGASSVPIVQNLFFKKMISFLAVW